jgi:putative ABC transport system permease protein
VTANFFDVLGTPPALGRTFSGETNAGGGERLVVISDDAWEKLFARDRNAVGRRLRVNGEPSTVVAVMPKGFEWPDGAGLWLLARKPVPPSPLDIKEADPLTNRDARYFEAIGRLKPGASLAQAQQDLHAIALTLRRDHPAEDDGLDVRLTAIREDLVGDVRGALLVIQGAVGLVLLIACANVSSLLIARGTGRRRELTIRTALGASRAALVRQLLAESLLLGIAGGTLGLLATSWLVRGIVRLLPGGVPRADEIRIDVTVMAVTIAASIAASVLFGILPALQASRVDAAQALKQTGDRGSARSRGRAILVAGEIALTLVLLAGAGLLGNSFVRLRSVDPGFVVAHATVGALMLPQARYPKGEDQTRLYHALLERLATRPELQACAVGFPGPLRGNNARGEFQLEGTSIASRNDRPYANLAAVSGGYFAAMGIPLIAGRTFDDRDISETAPVGIVSATFAKKYWPGQNPIGKRLRFEDDPKAPWMSIVGVAADTRQLGLSEPPPPLLYVPHQIFSLPFTTVTVRSALPHPAVASLLNAQLAAVDPDLAFYHLVPLETDVRSSLDEARFRTVAIGVFALLALVLAAVGVYGLISYTVMQRTREIGIRVALGASPGQVLAAVGRDGLIPALAGTAAGLAGAAAATRALSAFLYGVGSWDPATFSGVAVLLLIVAGAATYVPSRRALRVDPVAALRTE